MSTPIPDDVARAQAIWQGRDVRPALRLDGRRARPRPRRPRRRPRLRQRPPRTEAQAAFVPLTDPRASTMLDLFARPGAGHEAEAFGVMPAAEYDGLLSEVHQAHNDPANAACLFRLSTVVATVGNRSVS